MFRVKDKRRQISDFLSPWKNKDIDILNMKIERSTINTLGVHTGRSLTVKETRNFSDQLDTKNRATISCKLATRLKYLRSNISNENLRVFQNTLLTINTRY